MIDLQDRAYQNIEEQMNKELNRLQLQQKDLQASPTHNNVTHHHDALSTILPKMEPKEVSVV